MLGDELPHVLARVENGGLRAWKAPERDKRDVVSEVPTEEGLP